MYDVCVDAAGQYRVVQAMRTEVYVTLSGGQKLELYAFTQEILRYWKEYL
jgi:hypothetical protein